MFWIEGLVGSRSARVVWTEPAARGVLRRGLDGDLSIVDRAIRDEVDGRTFRSTPTGPFYRADLDDPVASLVQLTSYFLSGYVIGGDPPAVPIDPLSEGAVP